MSGAEPAYYHYLRFARNVLIVDLAMGAVVLAVSVWRGWTSVEESTLAILVGGGALIGIAVLPGLAVNAMLNAGNYAAYKQQVSQLGSRDLSWSPRITWTLLAGGFIPIAYAAVVAAVVL